MVGCLARPVSCVSVCLALINIYRKRGSLKHDGASWVTLGINVVGAVTVTASATATLPRMAEARQGAQQFGRMAFACPSSREVVIEIKRAGPSDTRIVTYWGGRVLKSE
jgi:hypothetical protein